MNAERRIFKRMPVEFKAHCIRNSQGTSQEYFLSFAKDISLNGMRLISSKAVGIGERLTMALEIPIYFLPLLLYGEIAWIKNAAETRNNLESGVKFFKMEPIDNKRLKKYLSSKREEYTVPTNG